MSWIDRILNLLFPPPVPRTAFLELARSPAHEHYAWIFPATSYTGNARKIVKYIKVTPDSIYLHECARLMAATIESYLIELGPMHPSAICLVPVPQHARRTHERGFNQSQLLAEHIQRLLPYTTVQDLLIKTRVTEKQALLPKRLRSTNQRGAFACTNRVHAIPKHSLLILVDDIATTGSTLVACKAALVERGFDSIIGVVFAHSSSTTP